LTYQVCLDRVLFWSLLIELLQCHLRSLIGWSFFVLLCSTNPLHPLIYTLQNYTSLQVSSYLLYLVDFGGDLFLDFLQSRLGDKSFFSHFFSAFFCSITRKSPFQMCWSYSYFAESVSVFISRQGSSHLNLSKQWHERKSSLMSFICLLVFLSDIYSMIIVHF
jgi:hypothetical protein